MATALAEGLVRSGLLGRDAILAGDPSDDARQAFCRATGAMATEDNLKVVAGSDTIILAVKPAHLVSVLDQLRGKITPSQLVVSIVAGVRLQVLAEGLGPEVRLARVMPNTPCLVGKGACGYCLGPHATDEDARTVARLLEAVGTACQVDEKLLDAVTGLSGSGPAYVYEVIQALSDGGVLMGLSRSAATGLAAQTVLGAAEMVLRTGEHPTVLRDRVASPAGTTMAALRALERGGLRRALIEAVAEATRRSAELGGSRESQ